MTDQSNSASLNDNKGATHTPSLSFDGYVWNSLTILTDFSYNEVRQNGSV